MNDIRIKKCPFCNGDAFLEARYTKKHNCYFVFVRCEICGATSKTVTDNNDPEENEWNDHACNCAIRAWNMRSSTK